MHIKYYKMRPSVPAQTLCFLLYFFFINGAKDAKEFIYRLNIRITVEKKRSDDP